MINNKIVAGCVCLVVGAVGLVSGAHAATTLLWCGNHDLSLNMEQVPADWWAWGWNNDSMWLYNQYMDIYRYHASDGSWGSNGDNEFGGWPSDAELYDQWGFHWGSGLAVTCYSWYCECCEILESDILFNPAYGWTEDREYAEDSSDALYYSSILLHEMGHSWGEQTKNETYDYDEPTVMHSYSYGIVQDREQIHWSDAWLIRDSYDGQTGVPAMSDMGVMSKYALSHWRNSTVSPTTIRVGNNLSLTNVTVENTGTVALSNVRIRFYLSTNRTISTGDRQLGGAGYYWSWGSFCAVCRGVYGFTPLPVPTNTPAGVYWVGAIVSYNGDSYSGDDLGTNSSVWFHQKVTVQVVPGAVQFKSAAYSVAESAGSVRIYVSRTGGSDAAASVNYATANVTALAGSDYTAKSGTLNWSHGDAADKYFDVAITNDTVQEGDETFTANLSSATGASMGSPTRTTVTIPINDQRGTVQFRAAAYTALENSGSRRIFVSRTNGSYGAVSVHYATANGTATAGSDYTATSGTLNWADGNASDSFFDVPIIDDAVQEGDETFTATLSSPGGGAALGSPTVTTVTIPANDAPTGSLQFKATAYSGQEGRSVRLYVSRTGGSSGAASVNYAMANGTATAGADFTATSGTLNWTDGDAADKSFLVPIIDDTVEEDAETFTGNLSGATGASLGSPSVTTVSILANDQRGSVQFRAEAYTVGEADGSVRFYVSRTEGSYGAATVNYATANGTATAGSDYTAASGTLSWADGDSVDKLFDVFIVNDVAMEGDETFTALLSGATGASLGAPRLSTATIAANDGISLPEALDNLALPWTNTDPVPWFGQPTVSHDGVDAGQSGAIAHSGSTAFSTVVTGPGSLTFWCRVSSEANFDFLGWSVDGVLQEKISGEVAWAQKTLAIAAGAHTVKWKYWKNASAANGVDTSWVDQVVWTAGAVPLPEALDNIALVWTNVDPVPWFGQTTVSHDGVDAGQSGAIAHSGSTAFTTVVTGPGTLTFWCRVSSEVNFDFLGWSVDGVLQEKISGEVAWAQKTLAIAAGAHTIKWKYWKNASLLSGQDRGWVDQVVWAAGGVSLPEALDNTLLVWTNTDPVPWFGQTTVSHDGVDAARSGAITDNGSSLFSTVVTGPGRLTFWCRVSSEANFDFLGWSVDGVLQQKISGEVPWAQKALMLGAGVHTIRWKYWKNASVWAGQDCGWVDQVVWTPSK